MSLTKEEKKELKKLSEKYDEVCEKLDYLNEEATNLEEQIRRLGKKGFGAE